MENTFGIAFTVKQWGNIQSALIAKIKTAEMFGLKTYMDNEQALVNRISRELVILGVKKPKSAFVIHKKYLICPGQDLRMPICLKKIYEKKKTIC